MVINTECDPKLLSFSQIKIKYDEIESLVKNNGEAEQIETKKKLVDVQGLISSKNFAISSVEKNIHSNKKSVENTENGIENCKSKIIEANQKITLKVRSNE